MKFIDDAVIMLAAKDPDSPVRAYVPESVDPLTEPLSETTIVCIGEPVTHPSLPIATEFPVTALADCEKFTVTERASVTVPPVGQL